MPKTAQDFTAEVDAFRKEAAAALDQEQRAAKGQFMTPRSVAALMASMFSVPRRVVRLLDAGAGVGSLTAATVQATIRRDDPPERIEVTAYEIEPLLLDYLTRTLSLCAEACERRGIAFTVRIEPTDFLEAAERRYSIAAPPEFNCAILNPPYRKMRSSSEERRVCRSMGLEVSNLYAAFWGASVHLLEPGAELVAITPRSFANGPYFRAFRGFLLSRLALRRLHVFESREHAFREDDVLQENVVTYAERDGTRQPAIEITTSRTPDDPVQSRLVPWGRVVYAHDQEQFIHLITDEQGDAVAEQMARCDRYLRDVGVAVSTGPVVDFRAPDFLRDEPGDDTVPLLYPTHLNGGNVDWPRDRAKANALALSPESERLTLPNGDYVLVKRFTAKEERRRVVAAVYEAETAPTDRVAFENHLNFFHEGGSGLPRDLARGLALYLNSSLVDTHFRQFSGHTQVNAADLRNMPYPPRTQLEEAGRAVGSATLSQEETDRAVERYLIQE